MPLDLRADAPVLSEASVFERLRRTPDLPFDPEVGLGGLVEDERGAAALAAVHREYLAIGLEAGLPMLLQTDTWRAHPARIARSPWAGRDLNGEHVALLHALRAEAGVDAERVAIGGLVGPLGDGYGADVAPNAADAERLMRPQADALAAAGADLLVAGTLPDADEALGLARALAATGLPYLIGVVVRPDGTMLDGTPLRRLVAAIDEGIPTPPLGYTLNCVHPSVADAALSAEPIGDRAIGLFANASALPPEELDGRADLDRGEVDAYADALVDVVRRYGLAVLGGCCGTDGEHLRAVAARLG